jgi:hypothetical protein
LYPPAEEADDPELIVSQGDHAGRILVMGLPVNVFQKFEDPPDGWVVCEFMIESGIWRG